MSTLLPEASSKLNRSSCTPSRAPSKVGLDLGAATTSYRQVTGKIGAGALSSSALLPSLLCYPVSQQAQAARPAVPSRRDRRAAIGDSATGLRDQMEVISPLLAAPQERAQHLLEFGRALRAQMARQHPGWPWGVLACPNDADETLVRDLRALGKELFQNCMLASERELLALALLEDPLQDRRLVVDVGFRGVRASVIGGLGAKAGVGVPPQFQVPRGGRWVDHELKTHLSRLYPDLMFTDYTVARMKEDLSFVAPASRTAQLKVVMERGERVLEVTQPIQHACEGLVPAIMEVVVRTVRSSPARLAEILPRIILVGGGACIPGLPLRLQAELAKAGLGSARVRAADDPRNVVSLGALRLAVHTPDEDWARPCELGA